MSQNLWPTTNLCPTCEVYAVEDECWVCGGPMVRKAPRWNSVHVFHAERRSQAVAGRIVRFDPIDDLL